MPTRNNPEIAGCSMILSGLRLFDIRDVKHPREVAYFNKPVTDAEEADRLRRPAPTRCPSPRGTRANSSVWYTDTNSGFYVVRLTNGVQKLLPGR